MDADLFRAVRERVDAQAAARFYGVSVNNRGWAVCPFHADRHPSMSFKNGRFRCWACQAGGDAVDFVARLFNLRPLDAVRQLNNDFHLELPVDRPQTAQEHAETQRATAKRRELSDTAQLFEAWRSSMLDKLTAVFRTAHLALKDCQSLDDLSEAEALAVQWQPAVEFWADCLLSGDVEAQMGIFRDRKGVEAHCDMILNLMQTKSGAA